MAWTQAQRDALAAAIASGAMRVSYADRTVQYHDLSQMRALLDEMDRELTGETVPRFTRVAFARD